MDILEHALIIAGLGALGALWVFAVMGMLRIGWESLLAPLMDKISELRSGRGKGDSR